MTRPALFLDRDGVIVRDHARPDARPLEILPGASGAIRGAREAGFGVFVVTNQPIVARGLMTESKVLEVHARLSLGLAAEGAVVDAFYVCPHHPDATVPTYRLDCACRKPRPGLLLAAARDHAIDLAESWMVGDRRSDIAAGQRAGCRTILVRSGMHAAPPIVSPDSYDDVSPDATMADLAEAVRYMLTRSSGTSSR